MARKTEKSRSFEQASFSLELPNTSRDKEKDLSVKKRVEATLSSQLYLQLLGFVKKEEESLPNLLKTAFGAFLYRYCRQEDFTIGILPSGQKEQDVLPFRFQISPESSYSALLKQTKRWHQKIADTGKNQVLSFLGYNVYFSMGKSAPRDHDLSLFALDEEKKLHLSFEYPVCKQNQGFMEQMLENFQVFLKELMTHPDQAISHLKLMPSKEKERLLEIAQGPKTGYPRQKSVVAVFEEIAKKFPNNCALKAADTQLTYEKLNKKANQLACYLQKIGVKKQEFVGIYLERSVDLYIGILAILKAGAIYVPIDASYPDERKQYMIGDSGLKVLLTSKTFADQFPKRNKDFQLIAIDEVDLSPYSEKNLGVSLKGLDLAFVTYTSGTTGTPKGVLFYHRCINRLVTHPSWVDFNPSDRFLQISNISFDVFVHELWGALLNGATLCIYPQKKLTAEELGEFIQEEKITQIVFTARLFTLMVEEALETLKGVRTICSCGDVMSAKHAKIALKHLPSCRLINACGHTENTTHTTAYDIKNEEDLCYEVPIGKPIGETSTYILDQNQQLIPFGAYGELCTGGDGLTKGYLNLPELTAEKYIIPTFSKERLYRTGDLACYLPDGNLSFLGRIDTQVKIRGFRIELSGVEEVIRQFKNVSDCIALVHQSGDGGKQLVAYITSRPSTKVDEGALREWVASKLPSYMMPSFFVILKKFPMTPNGKVDRKALKPPEGRKDKSFSLKTETEKKVAGVWSRILHLKSIDRNDHFFKIGGDSISAMQTASQLRKIFRCPVTVATLFNHPVLSDLTKELEATQKVTQEGLKRRETLSPVPLSYNQESLWLIDKLSPEQKLLYMIFYAYRIEGAIDLKRLEAALEKIFERHEMLRTYFKEKGGDCFQWIEPSGKNFFRIVDVSDEEEALSLLHESFTAGMDLGQLPLLEVRLFKVKPQLHLMAIRVHHIIFDVLSYENLFREWTTLYSGQSLPELPVQYGDYALWQRKRLKNQAILKQLDFWKSHLSGCQELLELPIDRPRPPTFQGNGKTSSALFSSELSAQLKGLAKDKGVTLYTLLFAIFKVFLYRYSMQEDIIVGTPFANRTRQELDPLIGYFLQVFAVRSDLGGNPEFTTFLLNLNQTLSNCYQNGDIPFEMVVSAINPPRNSSIHPLFQVLFVFENITLSSIQFEKTPLTPIPIEVATAKFDLSLFIFDREEGLECRFEYCTDLFEPETITRMLSNFEALLKSVVKEPEAPIGSLSVIPKTTYHQIVNTWNEVSYDYPQNASIPMLFEDIVKQDPERIALRFDGISTSYGSLNEQGNQIAHFLQKMGIKRGDFVGVYLERSDDLVKVILAILKAGAVYVPIDASYPKERKSYMITHTGLKVLITHRDFAEQFPEKGVKILCLEEEDLSSQTRSNLKGSFSKTDLAYLNFTSGSSGKPKGVEYTQIGIIRLLKEASWLQIGEGDRMLQISNISFDMMAAEVWGALLNGATLCIYPQVEISPHELGQFIVQENISHFYLTARLFVLMVEEGLDYLKKVKFFSSTGDVMSTHHAILARKALPHCRVMNVYGPTETHIATTFLVDSEPTTIPIGRPVAGTPVYILDAQKNPVPIGAFGELYVGGDGVARGYLNNPELTAEKFVQDPFGPGKLYRTGDLVRYRSDGNIEFHGRIDSQVKILGFRIELEEVEEVMREYPKVSDAVAIAKQITENDKHLVVYIEQKEGEKVSIEEVRDYASTKLPKHALPSYFVFMEQFPLTPNGKIDRRNLPAPTQTLEERRFDPPKTQTEKKLAKLWATLLKVPRVGREDNFFHIGGHSILAMQLNSQVKRDFKHPIPVNLIFQKSTLRSYAEGIDQILAHGVEAVFSKKSFDLWRRDEVTLDPTIKGEGAIGATKEQYTHPKNIFLTGATGFIGAFFLKDLIEKTEATIHALCRAKDSKEGMERLMKTLKKYHIWKREYKSRIKAVPGALDVPLLGLQPKAFETLGSEIDSIFHFGAFVNHAMSYQEHRGANVVGVQEILRLSSTHRLKPLHFISTVAVLEGITEQPAPEDAEIDQSIGLTNGYVESKWVGEKIIHLAQSRGIPCTILRLPRVSGDSESGSGPEGDFLWRVVQASLLLKMAPDVDLYDDLTPVDFICAAILEISKKEEWINHPFHVISPDHLLYKDVFMWLKELGYPLKIVSFAKWKKTLVEEAIKTGDARLQALASLMADFDLSKPTQIQKLSFKNLKAALKERGIECPRIDQELFKRYVDYYIKTGFLPKPRV